jgi:uncharacterized protein YdeI (YjbR/CyaY-like superfamily)
VCAVAAQRFETRLAYTHRREHVEAIEEAKREDTRRRRIEGALALLRGDRS